MENIIEMKNVTKSFYEEILFEDMSLEVKRGDIVGLDYKSKKPVKKYSLGMKQRLGIAMAIMENPMLLLLDEPMNALDKDMVVKVRELLMKKNKEEGVTILITSHNEKDIDFLCTHVYEVSEHGIKKKY